MSDYLILDKITDLPSKRYLEIVERKGLGHPDTLADGMAEAISNAYSKYCLKHFGAIPHHNVDKTMIIGGQFDSTSFGKARMIEPIEIMLNGRMSTSFGNEQIDIASIQENAAKEYLRERIPLLESSDLVFLHHTNNYARYHEWFHPRSIDDLPELKNLYAADTSISVGYWPLSLVERLTILLEQYINGVTKNPKFNYLGFDVKVMSVRTGSDISVTIAVPFISKYTPSAEYYFEKKRELTSQLLEYAYTVVGSSYKITVEINTQEKAAFAPKRVYMLAIGSCIEAGEEGVVGRGNQTNGLISTFRPHSMEAAYGKNPVYHSGKVYGYVTRELAKSIAEKFECECTVYSLCRNGEKLIPPTKLFIQTNKSKLNLKILKPFVNDWLEGIDYVKNIVLKGKLLPTFITI